MSDPGDGVDSGSGDANPEADAADPAADREQSVEALYDHLAATAERPVARGASAHLGEAEAVARDLHERPASAAVVRERAGHVLRLLQAAEDTEDEVAAEHVAAAVELAAALAGEGEKPGEVDTDDDA